MPQPLRSSPLLFLCLAWVSLRAADPAPVPQAEMQRVYEEVRTPFKYGVVLKSPDRGELYDCPSVFRYQGHWVMVFAANRNNEGYRTLIAQSEDLLHWSVAYPALPFARSGWDGFQADGAIALVDTAWGGSCRAEPFQGKYWMTYLGGAKPGYETDPLAIGVASSADPLTPTAWRRFEGNPVLAPDQPDARAFEKATLFKSQVIWDRSSSLGAPFVMFYNAKQPGRWIERIGMAVSHDMVHWKRLGDGPVIENLRPKGGSISGDPQIVRIGGLWVMFYFGAGWKPGAFDTFACSRDLTHWTHWDGPPLISGSEPWDKTYAHKPWLIKVDGIVYHFYCAVGEQGRVIALATSQDLHEKR